MIWEYKYKTFSEKMEKQIKQYRENPDNLKAVNFTEVSSSPTHASEVSRDELLKNDTDVKEEKVASPMDDSSTQLFLGVSLLFLILVVVTSIIVDDLSLVFGLIGSWNESMLNFLFPGLFFLSAVKYSSNNANFG